MNADGAAPSTARVLIVDDSPGARRKLALAVAALGHETVEVSGGALALERLEREAFDLVLLDVLMPGMDGLELLARVRADERLSEIPVIVVSGLENEPGVVIVAIRLGALDFLPKAFESVLLRARIESALRRGRNRRRELAELADIRRLGDAAELLEGSLVSAERLALESVATRGDPIGRFAIVFIRMAASVHARERTLRRRLAMRRGLALLLSAGLLFGLTAPLSKLAVTASPHPAGLSLAVNAITATVCLSIVAWRRTWPELDAAALRFVLLWGLCGASLAEVVLFSVAAHVPASTLSVIIVLESFLVFALASIAGAERADLGRLGGLSLGLLAVLVILAAPGTGAAGAPFGWMLLALLVPLCYAGEDLLLAFRLPPDMNLLAAVGLASLAGCALLLPFVWLYGDAVPLADAGPALIATVVALSLCSCVGTVLHARLVVTAGAVFGSQCSYVITLAGIAWAMLLLGERPAEGIWIALGILFAGLLLVGPKREPDDVLDVGVFGSGQGL